MQKVKGKMDLTPTKKHEVTVLWGALTRASKVLAPGEVESVIQLFFEGLNNDGA